MISASALYVAHAGSSHRSSGCHACSWWRCTQRTCTAIPRLDMKNRHTLDGLAVPNRQFCRAFWRQVGSHVSLSWRSQQFFSSSSPVTACQVHESFPGEKHMGDGHPPVSGTGASAVKSLSIRSGRPARSAAGTVVVGLGAGCDTPSRPSRLHEPAHRPSGLVATPPAFQGFVDPSITGGFVRSSREEDTSQKLASSSTALCGMSDIPLLRQGVAALNATPPGQWHITQVPGWLPSLAVDVRVSCFYRDSCAKSGGPGTVVPGLPQNRT